MRIGNIIRQTGRLALAVAVVAGVTLAVEKPAQAISGGEAAAIGWIAEQMSCTKPGSVDSALRVPPPMVSSASWTRTRSPARASSMAAESPFGPLPTTTASGMGEGYRAHAKLACLRASRNAHGACWKKAQISFAAWKSRLELPRRRGPCVPGCGTA